MLDRGDGAASAVADHGAELGRGDGEVAGVDQAVAAAGEAGAEKDDAVIGFGGMEDDRDVGRPNERRTPTRRPACEGSSVDFASFVQPRTTPFRCRTFVGCRVDFVPLFEPLGPLRSRSSLPFF